MAKTKTPHKKPAPPVPDDRASDEGVDATAPAAPQAPVADGDVTHIPVSEAVAPLSPASGGEVEGEGATDPDSALATTHLLITSAREGFRRAGRPWSVAPTLVEIGEFDEGQVAALLAEPMFQAVAMTAEAAAAWVADQAA